MKKLVAKGKTSLLTLLAGAGYSRTKVKQLLKHRAISAGAGPIVRQDHPLLPGDEVIIKSAREMDAGTLSCRGIEIVYEDEALIVINKPAGLLTIATEKEKTRTAYYQLNACLKERPGPAKERIFIVHRLDRDTSGLLVFAKTETVKRKLQANWKGVDKKYAAVVEGTPAEKSGRISSHLSETKTLLVHKANGSKDNDRFSVTNYEVMKAGDLYALVDITLETGRKNQIRVHLADLGHPIAGDRKYGAATDPLGRLGLHAYYLAFEHPGTEKRLEFQIKMPEKFRLLCRRTDSPG